MKFYIVGLRVLGSPVAPFAGAWIEIPHQIRNSCLDLVAPFAGAWIEILLVGIALGFTLSLPSRERGLKYKPLPACPEVLPSLPSRERGLK